MRRISLSASSSVSTTQQRRHVGLPSRLREVGLSHRTQGLGGNLCLMGYYSTQFSKEKSTFSALIRAAILHPGLKKSQLREQKIA
jgi:hypothetical protein